MSKGQTALFAFLSLALVASRCIAAEVWWNPHYRCRRIVRVTPEKKKLHPGKEACYVRFWTAGRILPDGADVRVVAKKKEIPRKVIMVGPGDICKIVFEVQEGITEYEIYYDNPNAKPPDYKYVPRRGLLLETRQYRGGGFLNWRQMQESLKRSEKFVLGRDYVPNVFLGYNPFGPSENFISIFDGWIAIPSAGKYYFATTSDDASFLFIDGKLVVDWPGVHRAVPNAAHFAPVTLTQGLHKFTYYHVQAVDRTAAVAAWLPPWQKVGNIEPRTPEERIRFLKTQKFEVIPEAFFPKVLKGELVGYEIRGERVAPDFEVENVGEVLLDDHPLVRLKFTDKTPPPRGTRIIAYYWDFGDGITATGKTVEHIYLRTGDFKVKFTVGTAARQYSVTQTVRVDRDWSRQINPSTDTAEDYCDTISNYDFDSLEPDSLMVAARLFHSLEKPKEATELCERVVFKVKNATSSALFEAVKILNDMCRKPEGSPELTLKACAAVEARLKDVDSKAEVAVIAGDVLLNMLNKPDEAMKNFQRVIAKYDTADRQILRRALVGLGDVYRARAARGGKDAEKMTERAMEMYAKAEAIPVTAEPYSKAAVRIGAFARAIEMYIRTGELDAAEDFIESWEWEFPTERIAGHSRLLYAKLLIARKDYEGGVRELEKLVTVNPKSTYAPEALMTEADCYLQLGDAQKAIAALESLVEDYPDSPLVEDARKKIEEIRKKAAYDIPQK